MGTIWYKLAVFLGFVSAIVILIFAYLFFEPFTTKTEEVITVINKEKWGNEQGKYFIFTEDEVFTNANDYYHNKDNADEIYRLFKVGFTYRVTVVGIYLPFLPRFRNILNIIETGSKDYFPVN
jgi:hypothetical protein